MATLLPLLAVLLSAAPADEAPDAPGEARGLSGHRAAWGPEDRYGWWLRTRPALGHTVQRDGRIHTRFGGRLVLIDTGMSAAYGGRPSALELRGGRLTALYVDGRVPLLVPELQEKMVSPARAPKAGATGR